MARKPKPMNAVKQVLQHHKQGKGIKWIARTVKVSKNTVRKYIRLSEQLSTPLEELLHLDDQKLAALIYPEEKTTKDERFKDFLGRYEKLKKELNRKHVTRFLLWAEYKQEYPGGYSYTQFCWHLQQLDKQGEVTAVIHHEPGDLLYIDFAGKTMDYVDVQSGEIRKGQTLITTLGYSQFSYVEAIQSQKTEDLIGGLNRSLAFYGGVPRGVVPDNMKTAVIQTDRYEPKLNQILEDFANHYQMAVIPARCGKPQDKALVEAMVNHAYRKIYAPLRNEEFQSLGELNKAIKVKLEEYHKTLFQGRDYSRSELFSREKTHLAPLPEHPFEIKKSRKLTAQKNCHVYLSEDRHYYSIPYQWIGQHVVVIYTSGIVTIHAGTKQIASHVRNRSAHQYSTVKEHLPSHLQHYAERSPGYYKNRASKIAPEVREVIQQILKSKKHPEQGYKSCDGVLSLARKTGKDEFIVACHLAIDANACNYGFIKRVIANGMAAQGHLNRQQEKPLPAHSNTRGKEYYQQSLNFKN